MVILGDSLTVMGWHDLYTRLDRDQAIAIVAWLGEGYNPGRFSIALHAPPLVADVGTKTFAPTRPDSVVLALGTNDAWERRSTTRALATMRATVDAFERACLVGVTLPQDSKAPRWSNVKARALNAAMRGWADQTVNWAAIVHKPGMLKSDGVHPTDRGLMPAMSRSWRRSGVARTANRSRPIAGSRATWGAAATTAPTSPESLVPRRRPTGLVTPLLPVGESPSRPGRVGVAEYEEQHEADTRNATT